MIQLIDHIGIAVESIDQARVFWESLGLKIEEIEEVPEEGVRVAMIRCGESRIELLEPSGPESLIAGFLAKRGPGIHHLCLATDDVRGVDAHLREAGSRLIKSAPTRGAGGRRVQFIHPHSTGGVLVELSEPAGRSGPGED